MKYAFIIEARFGQQGVGKTIMTVLNVFVSN